MGKIPGTLRKFAQAGNPQRRGIHFLHGRSCPGRATPGPRPISIRKRPPRPGTLAQSRRLRHRIQWQSGQAADTCHRGAPMTTTGKKQGGLAVALLAVSLIHPLAGQASSHEPCDRGNSESEGCLVESIVTDVFSNVLTIAAFAFLVGWLIKELQQEEPSTGNPQAFHGTWKYKRPTLGHHWRHDSPIDPGRSWLDDSQQRR